MSSSNSSTLLVKPSARPTAGGTSVAKDDLVGHPGDPVLHTPHSLLQPTTHVEDKQAAWKDGDQPLPGVLKEETYCREVMCPLEKDTNAKTTPTTTTSQSKHLKAADTPNVTAPDDTSDRTDIAIAIIPPVQIDHVLIPGRPGQRPGAYAYMPSGSNDDIDDEATIDMETRENTPECLAVAKLVECLSLEFALPHSEEPNRQRENKTRQYKAFALLSVLFLLLMAVLLSVLVPFSDDNSYPAPQNEFGILTTVSLPPSPAPSSLGGYVLSLLPEDTVNIILGDTKSPQSKAFHWLLDDDLFHHMPEERVRQRFALATLYFATNGDEWTDNTNWLNYSVTECDWYTRGEFNMKTQIATLFPGFLSGFFESEEGPTTICDQHGLYQHLWLDENNLGGSLPEELYMMTHLKTISMSFNRLQGGISSSIGLLTGLEAWALSYTFTSGGTIPTQIGLLTNLRFLSSEANGHQGTTPTEVWHLSKLEYLFLSRNPGLKGTIPPEIGALLNLRWFAIDETGLTGTIPTETALLRSVKTMSMNRNSFVGTVPSELGLLTSLFYLGLTFNDLTGTVPTELGLLTSLSQLSLRVNRLEGPIPSQLGLLTNLTWTLNLRNNHLTGSIPSELGLLTGLYELELRDNRLTGQIPSELGQATSMGFFSFASNYLSGSVPQELYALHASLHTLSLEDNPLLSGILPNEVCEINATCTGNGYNPCEAPHGFSFNCSSLLCGCGCNLCIP